MELNDLNIDPYFPDGTWCHNDGQINYYCVQHHCLPEVKNYFIHHFNILIITISLMKINKNKFQNFKFTKGIFTSDDVSILQNAPPKQLPKSDDVLKYFSIDSNKKPLLTTLKPEIYVPSNDDDWFDKDYLELPNIKV